MGAEPTHKGDGQGRREACKHELTPLTDVQWPRSAAWKDAPAGGRIVRGVWKKGCSRGIRNVCESESMVDEGKRRGHQDDTFPFRIQGTTIPWERNSGQPRAKQRARHDASSPQKRGRRVVSSSCAVNRSRCLRAWRWSLWAKLKRSQNLRRAQHRPADEASETFATEDVCSSTGVGESVARCLAVDPAGPRSCRRVGCNRYKW